MRCAALTMFGIVFFMVMTVSAVETEEKGQDAGKQSASSESTTSDEASIEKELEEQESEMSQKKDDPVKERAEVAHDELDGDRQKAGEKNQEKQQSKKQEQETATDIEKTPVADTSAADSPAPAPAPAVYKEEKQVETLFDSDTSNIGFFFDIHTKITAFDSEVGGLVGGRIGFSFYMSDYYGSLMIGAAGYGNVNPVPERDFRTVPPSADLDRRLYLGYGGMIVEYHMFPRRTFNFSAGVLMGVGGYGFSSVSDDECYGNDCDYWDELDSYYDDDTSGTDVFYVIEPELKGYVNIVDWFRVGVGVSYRFFGRVNMVDMNNRRMSGVTGSFLLSIGAF